ncbi:helix-turn-helix protein [Herbihabitans rhizosphaerae]|uniref:Helix-turn-helix protein n=1 Tax=Herbihabitans rhizosphaerae TaxID=1872711 RepID=A0A4Q7L790_9PSEU|nr:helix-turn-helix transcriptional regulator [Herbihabitans rhizosphaerae]RZS45156.1 helix-turn-helix protein [Herbihabitans rhizosphaerae]
MARRRADACYRELGAELRKRRHAAKLTERELGRQTGWSSTKISRIESGHIGLPTVDVFHYLGPCKVYRPQALEMLELCRIADRRLGYWLSPHGEWVNNQLHSLIFHESTAAESVMYEPLLVPGLLQTPEYALAMNTGRSNRSHETISRYAQVRMRRQETLHRPTPARFDFYVHEQALRIPVGGSAVMHEQVLKLVLLSGLPHITIRVVPISAGEKSIFGGAFRLFGFERHDPLAYLDSHAHGVFLEGPELVRPYSELLPDIAAIALNAEDSRKFLAGLASEYDLACTAGSDLVR